MFIQGPVDNKLNKANFNKVKQYGENKKNRNADSVKKGDKVSISSEGYVKYQVANENKLAANFDPNSVEQAFNLI